MSNDDKRNLLARGEKTLEREDRIAGVRIFLCVDARPKNKNRSFGNAHVTSGRTKNAREREGTNARSGTNGRWKLDTRFISWSDCDFRRGFKYWKYRAVAFNLPRDPIEFYKRGKSASIIRWRSPRGLYNYDDDVAERLSSKSLCWKSVILYLFWTAISRRIRFLSENASKYCSNRTYSYFRIVIFRKFIIEMKSYLVVSLML